MLNTALQKEVIGTLVHLKNEGFQVVVVHGGGPFIKEQLAQAGVESEFIDGHRKTTPEAMPHIEMALKGKVNGQLISLFNHYNSLAVGISGKDAQTVVAQPRTHKYIDDNGQEQAADLGMVGDVRSVNHEFLRMLLREKITPVIACVGTDEKGNDYNINADMMAGHIAGALHVDHLIMLTDIDGLRKDVSDASTKIDSIHTTELKGLFGTSIQGGMIPKMEACIIALEKGAKRASILNGTEPKLLLDKLLNNRHVGTTILA